MEPLNFVRTFQHDSFLEIPMQSLKDEGMDLGGAGAGAGAGAPKAEEKKEKTSFGVKLEKFDAAAKIKNFLKCLAFNVGGMRFSSKDPNAKPKRFEYDQVYDPYGPRPPLSNKVVELAERITVVPPEVRRQIGPTLTERLRHPKEKAPVILKQGITKDETNDIMEKIKAAGGVAVVE
ncbi:hypothetical protein GOBAR_AA21296 [Gossypium barbadense]|uniref:Ribosomal protein L7/L12 C-terminal domain-containing protein n=1 Tax=Gossypium barbadense TaxID=3634 RepID=A0A2P5X7Q6_GOSBA|nr:hypothetical protein GOBAR_AA21296 [Gossypium barbadense]